MVEVVDAGELARRLKVERSTILGWHRRGWIPSLRAGKRPVLFDYAAVLKALEQSARKGDGDAS